MTVIKLSETKTKSMAQIVIDYPRKKCVICGCDASVNVTVDDGEGLVVARICENHNPHLTEDQKMLKCVKDDGRKITARTFVYINESDEWAVMEKSDTTSRPIDERGDFGAYFGSYQWDFESKLNEVEAAGGYGAMCAHNIKMANKALEQLNV